MNVVIVNEPLKGALSPTVTNKPHAKCIVGSEKEMVSVMKKKRKLCKKKQKPSGFHFLQHPRQDNKSKTSKREQSTYSTDLHVLYSYRQPQFRSTARVPLSLSVGFQHLSNAELGRVTDR